MRFITRKCYNSSVKIIDIISEDIFYANLFLIGNEVSIAH